MSTMLKPETLSQQQKLADFCRSNVEPELIGTTDGRLKNYRRLVFSVVQDALGSSYPLSKNLLSTKEWDELCFNFFRDHRCQNPQVWRMPFELIDFTESTHSSLCEKYPWLLELMIFEWKEVEYYMMADLTFPIERSGDFWEDPWRVNPEMEIMALSYPLHMKNARFISRTDVGSYFCIIFRQPGTFKVKFMNVSPFFAWLIESMRLEPSKLRDLVPVMESQFNLTDIPAVKERIRPFFEKLLNEGMIH